MAGLPLAHRPPASVLLQLRLLGSGAVSEELCLTSPESVHAPTLLPCHLLPLTAYLAALTFYVSLLPVLCENKDTALAVRPSSGPPASVTALKGAAPQAPVG